MCMSTLRDPMAQPPGMATLARPRRPTSEPSTLVEARIRATSSYGASCEESVVASMVSAWSVRLTTAPSPASTSAIRATSLMSGTLRMVVTPGAKSEAAISLSAEFLAPPTRTLPVSGRPPVTTMDCMGWRFLACRSGAWGRSTTAAAPPHPTAAAAEAATRRAVRCATVTGLAARRKRPAVAPEPAQPGWLRFKKRSHPGGEPCRRCGLVPLRHLDRNRLPRVVVRELRGLLGCDGAPELLEPGLDQAHRLVKVVDLYLGRGHGLVGQHDGFVLVHLQVAPGDGEPLDGVLTVLHADLTLAKRGDHRGMQGQHAELAVEGRDDEHLGLAGVHDPLWCDYLAQEGTCHLKSPPTPARPCARPARVHPRWYRRSGRRPRGRRRACRRRSRRSRGWCPRA